MQHRPLKEQAGTSRPSSAMACSSSPVDCQPVSFCLNFDFFLSLEGCFICNCNNVQEITNTKAIFIWSRDFFSRLIVALPGIKILVKASFGHISRLSNQISMHKFGPVVERRTKAAILVGYKALALSFASDSHFLKDVN